MIEAVVRIPTAACETVGQAPAARRPYIRNDIEQSLSIHIQRIADDIAACGRIPAALDVMLTNSRIMG
jgi:hypothetical protein